MAVHVAILMPRYVALILGGRKTVESRLYRSPMPPIGCARVGERVYVKQSAGPFRAVARIAAVDEYDRLSPAEVQKLARQYNHAVCGDADYWRAKRDSRCAAFIRLRDVQPIDVGPRYTKSMRAWHVLDNRHDILHDLTVTAGGLRNRYLRIPAAWRGGPLGRQPLKLLLPDGRTVETDLTGRGHLRWRGWGRYYKQHAMRPGDCVRLVALGQDRYRVQFLRHA